jgi:hypothetical protein
MQCASVIVLRHVLSMVNSFNWGQNKSFWPDQKRREISTEAKMSLFFKQTQIVLLSFTIALLILGPRQLTRPSGQVKKWWTGPRAGRSTRRG